MESFSRGGGRIAPRFDYVLLRGFRGQRSLSAPVPTIGIGFLPGRSQARGSSSRLTLRNGTRIIRRAIEAQDRHSEPKEVMRKCSLHIVPTGNPESEPMVSVHGYEPRGDGQFWRGVGAKEEED